MTPSRLANFTALIAVVWCTEHAGRELLCRMVERADVLLENFSPGTMDGLGVGWSRLREINPRLIYATGTGFGISGPDRDNLAMDMTIQAGSGIMSVTGFPDGPPVKAGPTRVDFMGGVHLWYKDRRSSTRPSTIISTVGTHGVR